MHKGNTPVVRQERAMIGSWAIRSHRDLIKTNRSCTVPLSPIPHLEHRAVLSTLLPHVLHDVGVLLVVGQLVRSDCDLVFKEGDQ